MIALPSRVFEVEAPGLAVCKHAFDGPSLSAVAQDAVPPERLRRGDNEAFPSLDPSGSEMEFEVGLAGLGGQRRRKLSNALDEYGHRDSQDRSESVRPSM